MEVPRKPRIELPYDSAIPLLGTYPDKITIQKDTCAPVFIPALLTIAKTWKQSRCPSAGEWIRKMWYIYPMDYDSAFNKNEIMLLAATWMDLVIIILSKISQKGKDRYHITYIMWNRKYGTNKLIYKQKQTHRHREQTCGCHRGRREGVGVWC